jgi:hypothetical protein
MVSKLIGLAPTVRAFNYLRHEGLYYTLMMSTGLTFGTISALFERAVPAKASAVQAGGISPCRAPTNNRERG